MRKFHMRYIDLHSPEIVKEITFISIEPVVEIEVTIDDVYINALNKLT